MGSVRYAMVVVGEPSETDMDMENGKKNRSRIAGVEVKE
jgi:hypothetical protein